MSPSIRTQLAWTALLLVTFWIALPVRMERASAGPSQGECLTLADRPADGPAAIPALERCAALVPNDTELLADLGREYEAAGRLDDAERVYRQAIAVDADYADVRLALGRLLLRRGRAAEARQQADAALHVQPNRPAILALMADASRAATAP